ncbi:la-related protein 6C isoform X2 [Ricinus communis]|uniref:la-related protein 6C isoform X2 n=1 Tax=Ricinus communis TaxID=3988 RepID=UPI000772A812|nr:la-related protein 6C isoform X2 [Ricinus communis]|eukprot:XP_015576464.1 la-related protein 6C isoform X2 [Ricinus communis]
MAQAQPQGNIEEEEQESSIAKELKQSTMSTKLNESTITSSSSNTNNGVSFKFNAQAPEFVPRSHSFNQNQTQIPISGYFYPCFHYLGAASGSDWFFVGDQDPHNAAATYLISNPNLAFPNSSNKTTLLTDDLRQKILKQVEYQFGDMSLLANESMSKHISKDPEGYVPISVIASTKKMKSLVNNNHLLAQALQSSSKLVVSEDNKKVKRKLPFTEKDREELQSRTVVVENLPEDHSHQNLEKIFSVVGSVKTIRICHPQESNSSRTKSDFFMSNKLHALVEFEGSEAAEKAVENLNDERNWRKGLRVRPKSVLRNRKSEFEGLLDDEDLALPESNEDSSQVNNVESVTESNTEENSGSSKKGWAKGRGKGRGRGQSHGGRGLLAPSPQSVSSPQCEASAKHTSKGPRMPDGTRGFTMGRGKPLGTPTLASSMVE